MHEREEGEILNKFRITDHSNKMNILNMTLEIE